MKTLSQNLISLVLGAIILWLLQDKVCNKPKEPVKPVAKIEQVKIDTASSIERKAFEAAQRKIVQLEKQLDSALNLARNSGKQLMAEKRKQVALAAGIDKARFNNDTLGYIIKCDSLEDLVQEKDGLLQNNQEYYEAVIGSYNQIVDEKDKQLQAKDSLLAILRNSFSIVSSENISLAGKVNNLQKRSGRKYGLSPAIGYGYVTGSNKPQGFVGVVLTRDFIKFKL